MTTNEEGRTVADAVRRAADILEISDVVLGRILGLAPATVSRLKGGTFTPEPDTKPFELALLMIRLFRGLNSITGGDDTASRSWLRSENLTLRGVPLELVQSIQGLVNTVSYVDSQRARV